MATPTPVILHLIIILVTDFIAGTGSNHQTFIRYVLQIIIAAYNATLDFDPALINCIEEESTMSQHRTKKKSRVNMPSKERPLVTVPSHKCDCERSGACTFNVTLIELKSEGRMGCKERDMIIHEMTSTIQQHALQEAGGGRYTTYNIERVDKIDNPCLWRKFREAEKKLYDDHGYVNEQMLFHGTTVADTIVKTGFDLQYAKNGGMFGPGIYFAIHSSKSNQYAFGMLGGNGCPTHKDKNCYVCIRKILLCRVALGRMMKLTSASPLTKAPAGYDSVQGAPGNALKFPEYAVYDSNQIYPEYLISYKIVQ